MADASRDLGPSALVLQRRAPVNWALYGFVASIAPACAVIFLFGQGFLAGALVTWLFALLIVVWGYFEGGQARWFGAGMAAGLLMPAALAVGILAVFLLLHGLPSLLS